MTRTLSAPVTVAFDYTRSTGPVLGRFLTGLRDGRLVGGRTSDGRGRRAAARVRPGHPRRRPPTSSRSRPTGTVTSWTWVPRAGRRPAARPAVRVRAGHPRRRGRAVPARPRRRLARRGRAPGCGCRCAGPRSGPARSPTSRASSRSTVGGLEAAQRERASRNHRDRRPVTGIITPVRLDYLYAASPEESAFYRGLAEGRILGQRCPACHKVYVPPRSACPVDGVADDRRGRARPTPARSRRSAS